MEPKAKQRLRSLCLKALVPPRNYGVITNPQIQPIEKNQRKNCWNPSTPNPPKVIVIHRHALHLQPVP